MRTKKVCRIMIALYVLACLPAGPPGLRANVQAAAGETVTGKKTGREIVYQVQAEGMSGGQDRSVAVTEVKDSITEAADEVRIPADAYIYDGWEQTRVFRVGGIRANAFLGCAGITKVYIEGAVQLENHALEGLGESVLFTTASLDTKKALLTYGIPGDRITYQGLKSDYVVFGDSIAAGYALSEYNNYGQDSAGMATGDAYPTPAEAFASLFEARLNSDPGNYGPARLQNFAVSGSTSIELLDQLERGDYNHALGNADIVTVTIGSNDLLGTFIRIIKEKLDDNGIAAILEKDQLKISDIRSIIQSIPKLLTDLNAALAGNAELNTACDFFKDTIQPAILNKLHELAPEAQIYWTTLYNPFYGQTLDIENLFPEIVQTAGIGDRLTPLPLGNLAAPYIERMNQAFQVNTQGYVSVDLYGPFNRIGITNVNISREGDNTLHLNFDPHPNTTGHAIIADQLETSAIINETYRPQGPPGDQSGEPDPPPAGEGDAERPAGPPVQEEREYLPQDTIQPVLSAPGAVKGVAADTGDRANIVTYAALTGFAVLTIMTICRKKRKRRG